MLDPRRAQDILEARKWRQRTGKLMRVEFPKKIWAFINSPAQAAYLRGPNSGGKTYALSFFIAQIALGRYHPDYTGWKPTTKANDTYAAVIWCLSKSAEVLRDAFQTHLLSDVAGGHIGEGLIPKENIITVQMSRGIAGSVDYVIIKRDDGSLAKVAFKSYEQGREMLQGERCTVVACDEMFDDEGMLSELLARGAGVDGIFRLTATERLQQSVVAQWFYDGEGADRVIFGFGMDDVDRIPPEERARIKASYPPNEVESRYHGLPFRGGGAVFRTPLIDILEEVDPGKFPPYYKYLISLDFSHFGGSDQSSKFAALFWALDPFSNVATLFHEILMRGGVAEHYAALIAAGVRGIPIAWPHDGQQGQADGGNIAKLYKDLGLKMHAHHATFGPGKDGGFNRESGIVLVNELLSSGRLKVSKNCRHFQSQYVAYERGEDGQPIAKNDDLMSALRVGAMMLRIARPLEEFAETNGDPWRNKNNGQAKGVDDWDIFTGRAIGGPK